MWAYWLKGTTTLIVFQQNDHYPWEAANVDKQEVKMAFESTIIITAHGYDKKFFDEFQQKFSSVTGVLANHVGRFCVNVTNFVLQYATLSYMSLYDALFLYGLALRDAFEDGGGYNVHMNGSLIWSRMTNRQFIGATGQVLMNNKAIRVPSYATYHATNGTLKVNQIITFLEPHYFFRLWLSSKLKIMIVGHVRRMKTCAQNTLLMKRCSTTGSLTVENYLRQFLNVVSLALIVTIGRISSE